MRYFRPWRRRLWISLALSIVLLPVSPLLAMRDWAAFSAGRQTDAARLQTQGTANSTATSVASTTPTVTLPPTFTPTPPAPTPTPEWPSMGEVRLALDATPAEVQPGGVVTYTLHLTNAGQAPLTHLVISDTLPAGLVYVPDSAGSGQYDPASRRLTWTLAALDVSAEATLTFQAHVVPAVPDPILNTVEVSSPELPGRPTATASVHVRHAAEWVVLPDAAAHLAAPGGRVTLEVPAGAVDQPARFAYRSLAARPLPPGRTGLMLQFEFTAHSAAAGEPITRFQQPLRLTVDLTDLVDVDALKPGESLFVGYQDASTGQWMPLPLIEYQPGPVLSVELDHFTLLGAGTDHEYESGWVLAFDEPQVSLFDGGLTYRYPIDVPPGRGGLQPTVDLSYGSRRVDGTLTWIQTDWAGLGWSVDQVEITRQITPNLGCANPCWKDGWSAYENEFTLLFDGTGYELQPESAGQYYGRYHTEDETFLSIERRNKFNGYPDMPNLTKEYWIIRAKDGTEYRLGYTTASEQVVRTMHWYTWPVEGGSPPEDDTYAGQVRHTVAFRWRVDRIADRQGNAITFGYREESDSLRDNASYLEEVCYDPVALPGGAEHCGSRVFFDRGSRGEPGDPVTDWLSDDADDFIFYQRDYLRSIQVQFWNTETVTHAILSEYVFAYVGDDRSDPPHQTRLLDRITVRGRDGREWPATRFTYTEQANKGTNCTDRPPNPPDDPGYTCTLWDKEAFPYGRLTEVSNGYGGVITTTYKTPDGWGAQYELAWNYHVSRRWTKDRGTLVRQVDYTYPDNLADRCYEDLPDRPHRCKDPDTFASPDHTGGKLIGYKWVTETLKTGSGAPVAVVGHDFWLKDFRLNGDEDPVFLRGREIETRYRTPDGTRLQTVVRTYGDDTTNRPAGVHFVRLDRVDTYAGDTTAPHTQTAYSYDTYGNVTRTIEYGNVNVAGDERTTHYRYYPRDDGALYIVDRVARASVYAGEHLDDDGVGMVARRRYRYDDQTCPWEVAPTRGKLTHLDRWNGGSGEAGDCYAAAFDTTVYAYDPTYGNPTGVTDPLSRTTTTDYDTFFHTYPITRTNALSRVTLTRYYGVNGAPATGEGAYFGAIEAVTDPNGATTTYAYDVFGRLETIRRPGDEAPAPATVQYTYADDPPPVSLPFRIQVDRRQDASTVRTSYRFYDGLGQLIETKTPLPGNQQAVQHTTYDALGRVAEAYVPYYTTTGGSGYVAVDTGKPRTGYAYDALGRPKTLTHPDGRSVQTGYAGWRTTVVDENGHQTVQEQDAFGRLVKVEEYEGDTPPYSLYATTHYAYDVLDRLRVVTDTTDITTTIEYDPLGRKTGMDDPDMGRWSYAYDAAGNLTRQTDARGQTVCFYYDDLNRLTGKHYRTDTNCPTSNPGSNVRYTYDDGVNGAGRRTGMTDASGSTSWSYDARGRVVTETRTLGALGTYATTYGYNSADQVVTTTYPDTEVITTTYDIAGWPATLSSSLEAGDLGEMTYNAQGQPKLITYTTASLVTHFGYYGYNGWGIGDSDDAPNDPNWANGHVGRLWKLCTVPAGLACPQAGDSSSLLDLRYGYDGVGNILDLRDRTGGGDELQTFTYDDLDRLETASGVYSANYSYDAIGNLLTKSEAGTTNTLEYTDPLHVHAPKVVNGAPYTYDANGNLINRPGESLTYDAENRLRSVTTAGQTVTFTYDGDGRRVLRDTATETIAYIGPYYEARFTKQSMPEDLDDDCAVTVIDIMRVARRWGQAGGPEDLDGSGMVDVGDAQRVAGRWRETCHVLAGTTKYYALGGRRVAMRKVPAEPPGQVGTLHYLFGDHLGSSNVSYRSDGGDTQTQRYYPWGTIRPGPANTLPTDRTFTGQQLDETIGLLYYSDGAGYGRYYDPLLGRFSQPDTLVPNPGDPQQLNRYSYATNNPLRYTDPTGHWLETLWDIANVVWDIHEVRRDPSLLNIGALVVDVGATLLPFVPAGVGVVARGGKAAKAVTEAAAHADEVADAAKAISNVEDVRHATTSADAIQGILKGVDPRRFDLGARFGPAFYLAQEGTTAVAEVRAGGREATHVIRFHLDVGKAKVLDLADPATAKAWGYVHDPAADALHRAIAQKALEAGYDVIKFESYRVPGTINYAVLRRFDELLIPQMVSPVP